MSVCLSVLQLDCSSLSPATMSWGIPLEHATCNCQCQALWQLQKYIYMHIANIYICGHKSTDGRYMGSAWVGSNVGATAVCHMLQVPWWHMPYIKIYIKNTWSLTFSVILLHYLKGLFPRVFSLRCYVFLAISLTTFLVPPSVSSEINPTNWVMVFKPNDIFSFFPMAPNNCILLSTPEKHSHRVGNSI